MPPRAGPRAARYAARRIARRESGISRFQPMFRIWSIRTLGTDHETQTNRRNSRYTFRRNHTSWGMIGIGITVAPTAGVRVTNTGPDHPPRYRITRSEEHTSELQSH